MRELNRFVGVSATAAEVPINMANAQRPEQTATLTHYFIHAPGAHPLWSHYTLFVCHLRDIEGQSRPAFRRWPDASHEIDLIALNPAIAWREETFTEQMLDPQRKESAYLTPLNISLQLRNATDDQAVQLTHLVARAIADGMLPVETSDPITFNGRTAKERWVDVITSTMEHIRTGGHPDLN